MARYTTVPRVLPRIDATLKTLKVQPVPETATPEAAARRQDRFYMTPVRTEAGQLAWFKASLQDSPWLRSGLREEIRVQQSFAAYESKHRPRFDSPSYIGSDDDRRGYIWLLRKYWEGSYAGDMNEYFGFSPLFMRRVSPVVFANILNDVRGMTAFMRRRIPLKKHVSGWYLLDFHYYRKHFFPQLLQHPLNPGFKRSDVDGLEELIHQHAGFFQRHATTFTHGDLYPNNIMLRPTSGRNVVLFDWELSHLNLPTFDVAMAYLHAWRRPVWQKQFYKRSLTLLGSSPTTRTAWRLAMISLATRLAGFGLLRLTNSQPERYPKLPAAQRPAMEKLFRHHINELWKAYQQP